MLKKRFYKTIFLICILSSAVIVGCQKQYSDTKNISFASFSSVPDVNELLKTDCLESVDFSRIDIDKDYVDQILGKFPECKVRWNVPFSFGKIDSDTEEIKSSSFTEEDVSLLNYMNCLKLVDATGSTKCKALGLWAKENPEVNVSYPVSISGKTVNVDETWIEYNNESFNYDDFLNKLSYFGAPLSCNLVDVNLSTEQKINLQKSFPDFDFFWVIDMFGNQYRSTDTKIDLNFVNIKQFGDIETLISCLNNPEYVDLARQGFSTPDMEKLSEKFPQTKFVWMVKIGTLYVRTDITSFDIENVGKGLKDEDIQNLQYCTWLQAVRLSDSKITNLNVLSSLPRIRFLVASNTRLNDISAITGLPSLEYVDLHKNSISDITALKYANTLTDLNLSENDISDFSSLKDCSDLKVAILSANPACDDFDQVSGLLNSLPNCTLDFENKTAKSIWNSTEKTIEAERFFTARAVSQENEDVESEETVADTEIENEESIADEETELLLNDLLQG